MKASLNKIAKAKQRQVLLAVIAAVVMLIIIGAIFAPSHTTSTQAPKSVPDMTGVTGSEFSESENTAALSKTENQINTLQNQISKMSKQMSALQNTIQKNSAASNKVISQLQNRISNNQKAKNSNTPVSSKGAYEQQTLNLGISTTKFSYTQEVDTKEKTLKNYVPPGTFARAVLLGGADTNAGVNGQSDTSPILLRILDNGTTPNGQRSVLKGCFLTAAVYGDASSERGQIRLQRISCILKNRKVLDIPVEGTVNDMGGKNGIRGGIVMRNGQLLLNAGFSGFLSGIGNALQQTQTTQSVSPLGVTTSVPPSKVWQYGAYGGASTALEKLADYYIKLADLYHPIIQIKAGNIVDVWFLQGFSLDPDQVVKTHKPKASASVNNHMSGQLAQQIKSAQLGQQINGDIQ